MQCKWYKRWQTLAVEMAPIWAHVYPLPPISKGRLKGCGSAMWPIISRSDKVLRCHEVLCLLDGTLGTVGVEVVHYCLVASCSTASVGLCYLLLRRRERSRGKNPNIQGMLARQGHYRVAGRWAHGDGHRPLSFGRGVTHGEGIPSEWGGDLRRRRPHGVHRYPWGQTRRLGTPKWGGTSPLPPLIVTMSLLRFVTAL